MNRSAGLLMLIGAAIESSLRPPAGASRCATPTCEGLHRPGNRSKPSEAWPELWVHGTERDASWWFVDHGLDPAGPDERDADRGPKLDGRGGRLLRPRQDRHRQGLGRGVRAPSV